MIKIFFIVFLLLATYSSGLAAGAATTEPENYVTKGELAKIMAEAAGKKQGTISEFMFSEGLEKKATMSDLIEILFQSGLLQKDINDDKIFLGMPITRIYK
jgi:hypothetical protein